MALCHHRRTRPAAELRQNRSAPDRVGAAFRQLPGGRRLAIQATELHELATEPDTLGRWAPVVTDLAQQYATAQRLSNTDPTRRAPGAVLRRYLQIRDRRCVLIGCRFPARGADADHTHDHARGGPTVARNLGRTCRHDHRLKHAGG